VLIYSIGALLIYDITDLHSFDKIKSWIDELRSFLPKETPILIAGNKCDLKYNRVVSLDEAEE
jgi:GTPase SAR1 family protein